MAALYDAHAGELHRYLAARTSVEAAEDLVAETFLQAWQARASYRPERASARSWLIGIALNMLRRHFRNEARTTNAIAREGGRVQHAEAPDVMATARADAESRTRDLARALAGLRAEERDVLLLVALAELTPSEVAAATGINVTTVRTRLHRARSALRVHIEEGTHD